MKKTLIILAALAIVVVGVMIVGPFFVLNEGEVAVVVRFGKIVKVHEDAGLKFRSPFVDDVIKYPKKTPLLGWGEATDSDKGKPIHMGGHDGQMENRRPSEVL